MLPTVPPTFFFFYIFWYHRYTEINNTCCQSTVQARFTALSKCMCTHKLGQEDFISVLCKENYRKDFPFWMSGYPQIRDLLAVKCRQSNRLWRFLSIASKGFFLLGLYEVKCFIEKNWSLRLNGVQYKHEDYSVLENFKNCFILFCISISFFSSTLSVNIFLLWDYAV